MIIFSWFVISFWTREWPTCWDSTYVFHCIGFESGQHVEILWIRSIALDFESGQHVEIQLVCSSIWGWRVVNMLTLHPCFLLPWIREWSTRWEATDAFYYYGFECGQHVEIQLSYSMTWGFESGEHVEIPPMFLLAWFREWSSCWDSTTTFLYSGFESGQHVDILCIWSSMLDLRVVNMLKFHPCFLLHWIREWSTCWDSMNTCFHFEFESGQHVEVQLMCSSMLDSRVVNMLRFYTCFLLPWTRAWLTCWDSNGYVFLYSGFESCQHDEIILTCSFILRSRVVNLLRFHPCFLLPWTREWPTCWNAMNTLFYVWLFGWSACWNPSNMFFYFGI